LEKRFVVASVTQAVGVVMRWLKGISSSDENLREFVGREGEP
jgi:hypothetical protein